MNQTELTPAQRSMRARIAALTRVSSPSYDPHEATAAAERGKWAKYEALVDPSGSLAPPERRRRATAAWQADMTRARYRKSRAAKRK
jgi:hypothetical protein